MLWPGTVVGAAAGYALASIPGALLGVVLGQALDRHLRLQTWGELMDRLKGKSVLRDEQLLFVLLGRVAKAEGQVLAVHIQQARREMRSLNLNEQARKRAIVAFNRGKTGGDQLRSHLLLLKHQPNSAEGMLRACWRMVWADGQAGTAERELVVTWGKWLGWSSARVQGLGQDYEPRHRPVTKRGGAFEEALRLLGVSSTTEPDQIKRAYRRLLSRHHPDKLVGGGATPAQIREATDRTRELHNAYSLIRERLDLR
ncbi:DnaJ domain-containing protein [Pseudomonas sp. CFBP 8770]|uniref:DnaJ domain-containing protein n=1 Tax=unclassified Pseudomonas TaxID=196821 RepID=UPI00177F26A9|nr:MULTISPECIES: DnaJ domain-containing protein [unclassified Pseudomonas]MBD8476120.1 DnaJ domain-containing protein [Pseudomonas sp. CFBP 8773]MBD8648902.1 DnaJ domain-containing protein [Pseudomonas sp. CFBP 8770]